MKRESIEKVKKAIEENYLIAREMMEFVSATDDIERKISGMAFMGKFLSVYVTGLYASGGIERMLNEIGEKILPGKAAVPDNKRTLFVMTEASEAGGLTVLASNFIRWNENEECSIAFTRMCGIITPVFLKEAVTQSGGTIHYLNGESLDKARRLQEIAKEYSKIILMQHQEDVIPNLAFSSHGWEIPVYMYLHANFSLTYGLTIADRVLTINCYDIEKAVKYRGISRDRLEYFQFPNDGRLLSSSENELTDEIDDKYALDIAQKYAIDTGKKIVVTMAEDFKLEDIIDCSFIGFIERLIAGRNGDAQYIIIGPHPQTERWRKLEVNTNGKAKAVGYLNRKEATAIIKLANLYIVSFPMSASGNMVAEAYGVPFLTYALTERGRERQDKKTLTYSIEELIEKANEILDGNGNRYVLGERENILPKEEWQKQWKDITASVTKHKLHSIQPKRIVDDEEIINYQLMQKRASGEIHYFLRNFRLDFDSYEIFSKISEKHGLHVLDDHIYALEKNYYSRLKKESFFYDYLTKWLILEVNDVSIERYFIEKNIGCVSIYGAAAMGVNLFRKLEDSNVEVECFIDRASNKYSLPGKLIGITALPKKSKLIVNTAYGNTEEIRRGYRALTEEYEFVSLFDIIDELYANSGCI